jgi:hypothetical protein
MGSSAIMACALSGRGCSSSSVCSKRGPLRACGRGAWLADHGAAAFGACAAVFVGVATAAATRCAGAGVDGEDVEFGRESGVRRESPDSARRVRSADMVDGDKSFAAHFGMMGSLDLLSASLCV